METYLLSRETNIEEMIGEDRLIFIPCCPHFVSRAYVCASLGTASLTCDMY